MNSVMQPRVFTHCTRIAPGCHGGTGDLGAIMSRHTTLALAIKAAKTSDRLAVATLDEGCPGERIEFMIEPQGHPRYGAGRFGRSVSL